MTVAELGERMSVEEFQDWQAFFAWERAEEERARHQARAQDLARNASRRRM